MDYDLSLAHTYDANANAKARKYTCELHQRKCKRKRKRQSKKWKKFHFRSLSFALAFAFHTCEPRKRKRKCKRKDNKKTGSIGSMPPRRIEVKIEMASSILDEKLADSIRKYTVLYDKRCADKLKKTLAWKDFAKGPRDKKTVCITIKNINSKYNQINWIPYKRIFSVALNRYFFRPLSTLRISFTLDRHLGKSLTVLDCSWVFCLPCVWFWRMKVVGSCICICVARVNQALRLFTVLAQWRYSLDSNVNTPFFIIHTIIGVRHQSPGTKSRACAPAPKWALGPGWALQVSFLTYPYFFY